jgi:hypothetical protein
MKYVVSKLNNFSPLSCCFDKEQLLKNKEDNRKVPSDFYFPADLKEKSYGKRLFPLNYLPLAIGSGSKIFLQNSG